MSESLKATVARITQAMVEGVHRPGLKAEVDVGDLRTLITSWERRGQRLKELGATGPWEG